MMFISFPITIVYHSLTMAIYVFSSLLRLKACCGCGGGHKFRAEEEPTNNDSIPTSSPQIDNPTASPTSCLNSPENWHDTDGPNYNCYWYSQGANCETYGHLTAYAMYGKTANEGKKKSCCEISCVEDMMFISIPITFVSH